MIKAGNCLVLWKVPIFSRGFYIAPAIFSSCLSIPYARFCNVWWRNVAMVTIYDVISTQGNHIFSKIVRFLSFLGKITWELLNVFLRNCSFLKNRRWQISWRPYWMTSYPQQTQRASINPPDYQNFAHEVGLIEQHQERKWNPRSFWKTLNLIRLPKKNGKGTIGRLIVDDKELTEHNDTANAMNSYCTSIATSLLTNRHELAPRGI